MAPTAISELKDLVSLEEDIFCGTFSDNLALIFQYAQNDIMNVIETRAFTTVLKLRTGLCTAAKVAFAAYTNANAVQRKVKHTASSDVYALSYSLANELPTKELDKIFIKKNDNGESSHDDEQTDMADLLLMVINLRDTVKDLQNSAQVLQDENVNLRNRLDALESRIAEAPPPPPQTVAPSPQMPTDQRTQQIHVDGPAPTPVPAVAGDWPVQARRPYYSFCSSSLSSSSSDSSSSDTEDFSPVVRRRKANTKRSGRRDDDPGSQRDVTAARQPTRGNSSADGSRKANIYIGGVNGSNTASDIRAHLAQHRVTAALGDIRELANHGHWKSFRVTNPAGLVERVTSAGHRIWPSGVRCRPFKQRGGKPTALREKVTRRPLKAAPTHQVSQPTQGRRQARQRPSDKDMPQQHRGDAQYSHPDEDWPSLPRYTESDRPQSYSSGPWPYRPPTHQYTDWRNEQPCRCEHRDIHHPWGHHYRGYSSYLMW